MRHIFDHHDGSSYLPERSNCQPMRVSLEEIAPNRPAPAFRSVVTKVPEITAYFWITKVLTTGMGEATSDYLGARLGTAVAMPLAGAALVLALVAQFKVREYIAWVYWLAVVMVSVFGTMVADGVHNGTGVPYWLSTIVFAGILAAVLVGWYVSEKTLDIHSIVTRRREYFYWATVVSTFALGTAAGDMTASTFNLGYISSVLIFAVVIVIPAVGYWRFGLNPIFGFWFAYIVTRPLGASTADLMAVPRTLGGWGLGTGWVALMMTAAILVFVAYLAVTNTETADSELPFEPAVGLSAD
jgi:uncharacterized membrane-anchored protein